MTDGPIDAKRQARDDKKQEYLRRMFDRHAERFRAAAGQDPAALAREVHAVADGLLARDRAESPTSAGIRCRKGCDACCHGPVEIWPQEAALLVEAARQGGMPLDRARLARQSRYSAETWREQPAADRACVFLGAGGACGIYESRPNSCRKLLVVTDPALCDADQHPLTSVDRWYSWETEILQTAAQEVFGADLMPRALLSALE